MQLINICRRRFINLSASYPTLFEVIRDIHFEQILIQCTAILSFSRWSTLFFCRRLKLRMFFRSFENMRSLKNINIYHILVAGNSLYVQHLICERSYCIWIGKNKICLSLPAACRPRLVLNSPDFSYEVFTRIFAKLFHRFCEIYWQIEIFLNYDI